MNLFLSFRNLTKFEIKLWLTSLAVVTLSYSIGANKDLLTLFASLIGVTALIFVAKGEPLGQILSVLFSLIYGVISYKFSYYGEMITYLGMTAPIALISFISWIKHPYEEGKTEVQVSEKLTLKKITLIIILTILVTIIFYFILKYFNTANLIVSTISITTSFLASYLLYLRNPAYALAYASNDIILIILWTLATIESISYLPMIICFSMFLINDIYGYINWRKMSKRQNN